MAARTPLPTASSSEISCASTAATTVRKPTTALGMRTARSAMLKIRFWREPHCAAAEPKRLRNLGDVVCHQSDVGGRDRRVASGHARRYPDIGARERERVVDAVADYRDRAVALAQALDLRHGAIGKHKGDCGWTGRSWIRPS